MTHGTTIEALLPAVAESTVDEAGSAAAIYARLRLVAQLLRDAPPASVGGPRLLWRDARGQVAQVPVGANGIVIGRDPECDIVLASPNVSRRHCAVRIASPAGVEVVDLGSSMGTAINGGALPARVGHPLRDGDVIAVGGVAMALIGA